MSTTTADEKAPAAGIDHAARAHAAFSPSSTERWMNCPASVRLTEAMPPEARAKANQDNIHSAKGTAMHELSEKFLRDWTDPYKSFHIIKGTVKATGEKFIIEHEEWIEHVGPYVMGVREIFVDAQFDHGDEEVFLFIEQRLDISAPECYGTLDVAIVTPDILHVIDLKCGSGLVSAIAPQLKSYAVGLIAVYPRDKVVTHIFQAKNERLPHDHHTWTAKQLATHEKAVKKAIRLCRGTTRTAPVEAGPIGDHCKWCPAEVGCPARAEQVSDVLIAADEMDVANPENFDQIDPGRLAGMLKAAPQVRAYLDALQAYALDKETGIPGFKVVAGKSNRKWTESNQTSLAVKLEKAFPDALDHKTIWGTPAPKIRAFGAIEKIVGVGALEEAGLLEKPAGKPTLVAEDDPRPALDHVAALDDDDSDLLE